MKKLFRFGKQLTCSIAFTLTMANIAAADPQHDQVYLRVFNQTPNSIIKVTEGTFGTNTKVLYPGNAFEQDMVFTNTISNLSIKYSNRGNYTLIPGCPAGYFTKTLVVSVVPDPNNNSLKCKIFH